MEDGKYRLVYFDVRALAEPMRMMFAYTGTSFKDDRIPYDLKTWKKEIKQNYDDSVGQIPVLYWEDKQLSNSQAISRYLARQLGLDGNTDWDNARLDEVIGMVFDLFLIWRTVMFEMDPTRKIGMRATLLDPKFKLYYAKWSKVLEMDKTGPFILGEKVTHADFWLANFISIWDNPMNQGPRAIMPDGWPEPQESDLYVGFTKDFPILKEHLKAVESIPQIKEWIQKRPNTRI